PLIAVVLAIARVSVTVIRWVAETNDVRRLVFTWGAVLVGGLLQAWAVAYMDRNRPSAHSEAHPINQNRQGKYLRNVLFPLVAAAALISLGWVGLRRE